MKTEQINTILLVIVIYLLLSKKEQTQTQVVGMAKTIGDLGTTF